MSARRVLLLHSSAGRYGADRQLALLATGLDPARYVPLVVLAEDGPLAGDLRDAGVEVVVRDLAVVRRSALRPAGVARLAARLAADGAALGALARRRDVALVHTNTSVTLGGLAASAVAQVPHVWHVREIYAEWARIWPLHRRVLRTADALPCVSEATRSQLAAVPQALVVHDGLALDPVRAPRDAAHATLGLGADAVVVAVLGRISPWKGQDLLVRALAAPALKERDEVVAVLAGDAWPGEEQRLRDVLALADREGVRARVHHVGFRDDVGTVLGAADVVVVPSTQPDPFPNSALEAAAAGCCVVAAAHGGLVEMLDDGRTGVLVAPGDADALAVTLAGLADDPPRRAALGRAAAADVRARFAPERMLLELQALYDALLAC